MEKYRVKTRQDYDSLMEVLENEGKSWAGGRNPTEFDGWSMHKENTVIQVYDDFSLTFGKTSMFKDKNFTEYVAPVNDENVHPSYYHSGSIDVIKFGEENFAQDELKGFYRMNVLKYVTQFDKKNGMEDLDKASYYLEKLKEIAKEEPE